MQSLLSRLARVRLSSLETYPGNARRGDVDTIARSLQRNGQFQPLIVQKSTNYILVGNHTYRAARKLRWAELDVAYVDVDDAAARKIVLAANRIADLGSYDLDALAELLTQVDDLDGTGYTTDDLTGLLDDENEEENDNDPTTRESKKPRWGVVVYTQDETQQLELMSQLLEEGWDCRAL